MRKLVFLPLLGLAVACNDSTLVAPPGERPTDLTTAAVAVKKILFQDNFEDGNSEGWDLSGAGWSVETEVGNFVLSSSTGSNFAFASVAHPGWSDFREIAARDNKIKVYVNGSPKINVKDDDPFGNPGTIGFEVHDNTHVFFDDVLVTRLGPKDD